MKEGETGAEAAQYCFEASTGGKTICSGPEGTCATGGQGGLLQCLIIKCYVEVLEV